MGWLPSEDTFKVVDCYLSEGPKVLIRFGIAFLKLCSKELMKATSDNDAEDVLREFVSMRGFAGKYSFEALSEAAFSIRNFSRKTIYTLYEKHRRYGLCMCCSSSYVRKRGRVLLLAQHDRRFGWGR